MKISLFFFSILFFLGCKNDPSSVDVSNSAGKTSSRSASIAFEKQKVISTNQSYKFIEVGSDKKSVLLHIEERVEKFLGKDSSESYQTITAYASSGKAFDKQLWTKQYRADIISFELRYLKLTRNPRGENEDLSILLNYFSGEELVAFTGPNAFFAIPNQEEKRIIGFLARANDLDLLKNESTSCVGLLTYASATEKMQTIHLTLKNSSSLNSVQRFTPGMLIRTKGEEDKVLDDGRTVLLGSLRDKYDPSLINDIYIDLIFYLSEEAKEVSITIPIIKDKMDMNKAVYDKTVFELK